MFIARQPIFNGAMIVFGYELLYRDSEKATCFSNATAKKATASVLGGLFENGIDSITGGKKAFVNFDYDSLFTESIELIDPDKLIIEVVEDIKVDNALIDRLLELKEKGYKIALDDFVVDVGDKGLVPISDIIKYDIIATPLASLVNEVKEAIKNGKIILAEKIESKEEFETAKEMGFHFFQGYFFEKPNIIGESNNKKSIKINYIRILSELNNQEPSYTKIAEIIESDVNLAYRLLRVIKNNRTEDRFSSIKRPLVYMGFKEIERWINILMLQELATDKPLELVNLSLIRSKFGGSLANHSNLKEKQDEITTMLLFSNLDAILDLSMEEALEGISLTEDIKQALVHKEGVLSDVLNLVISYEKGYWAGVKHFLAELEIDPDDMFNDYLNALKYCKEITDRF